jgi:uncharacterized membrane protein
MLGRRMEGEDLAAVVHRNIAALGRHKRDARRALSVEDRVAAVITRFTGTMWFVYLHLLLVAAWLVLNSGRIPGVRPFDPFPYVLLAGFASVEAIFISTFVLIAQNRQAEISERESDLDLQINLLAEHEITRLIEMVESIAHRVGAPVSPEATHELKQDVDPEQVLKVLQDATEAAEQETDELDQGEAVSTRDPR